MADPPPQMEDILASIRRIIAEEPSPLAPPLAPTLPPGADDDVLELGEAAAPAAAPPVTAKGDGLLSGSSEAQSRQALATLASIAIDPAAADNTLDGLVREMLRPMLKQWLDANLPELVERLVAREVARLGGR